MLPAATAIPALPKKVEVHREVHSRISMRLPIAKSAATRKLCRPNRPPNPEVLADAALAPKLDPDIPADFQVLQSREHSCSVGAAL